MKWIPVPADAGASCDARERNAALVAIGACFVLAITVLLIAIFLVAEPVASLPTVAGSGTSGAGSGSGAGFGAGIGDGTGTSGSGPGAGQRGDGRGRTAPNGDPTPRGALVGAANETRPDAGESLVDGERTVVPEFGFTVSDETQPLTPNATTAGTPTGGDREGRSGAGGGAGTKFMGIETTARKVVYLLDYSSSMRASDRRIDALKAELGRSVHKLANDAEFSVVLFGLQPPGIDPNVQRTTPGGNLRPPNAMVMPPGTLIDANGSNKAKATSWMQFCEKIEGGATYPWEGMQLALDLKPEVIYFLTDGNFEDGDMNDLRMVLQESGNGVRVHCIAFASEDDIHHLQEIAGSTGGSYVRQQVGRPGTPAP
jgi:hypothetical protein